MKDGKIIIVNGEKYKYDAYYKRYNKCLGKGDVLCGKCRNNLFTINYGNYECIATCSKCNHKQTVYDGWRGKRKDKRGGVRWKKKKY